MTPLLHYSVPRASSPGLDPTMKAVLWRIEPDRAAVYTEDRAVVQRLLELPRFPAESEAGLSTYLTARGRVFAWQATFAASLWARVTRHLREGDVTLEDGSGAAAPRQPGRAAPPPPARGPAMRPAQRTAAPAV